jgi:hypothetical protein
MRKYRHYKKTQGVYKDFSGLRLQPSWVLSPRGVMDFSFHIHRVSAISKECLSWHFSKMVNCRVLGGSDPVV